LSSRKHKKSTGVSRTRRSESEQVESKTQPVLDVQLIGGLANRMIEYMVVRRLAAEVAGCRVSNVHLAEWGIDHPIVPGATSPASKIPVSRGNLDLAGIVKLLSSGKLTRYNFKSYAQWLPNFPDLNLCRTLFAADELAYPGFGPEYLVCNVRGGEVLDARHPDYTLLPIEFYGELASTTGLKLLFMGQIENNAYCDALKRRFPGAIFQPSRGAVADFQTFRNSKNLAPAVSTFSWLSAWLSLADMIILPVNGLFHPVQCPNVDLLPLTDARYRFYLFPINYSVPVDRFEAAHRVLQGHWRYMPSDTIAHLRATTPRWPKRLDRFISMFDETFYLKTNPDVAREVTAGRLRSGRDHYIQHGFKEGRRCFSFNNRWYSVEYPLAAFEVGQGDYVDLMHHFLEVGAIRGYRPVPPTACDGATKPAASVNVLAARTDRNTAALCAIMKNEGAYILEWVAFHRLIGFNEIFIYDNDSTDNTRDLLARLKAANIVNSIAWPSVVGVAPQRSAYGDVLPRVKSEWVCFIDADEFINLKQDDSIQAFLQRFPANVSAVAMNWRVFGSNGQTSFGADLVTRRFARGSKRQAPVNRHCKTIVRVKDIDEMHIHRCFLQRGSYVDEAGQAVEVERLGLTPSPRTDLVQINHYVVKSQQEFALKRLRGNANRATNHTDKYQRLNRNFFAAHDLNDESDLSIQRFDARLTDELAFLTQLTQD
jgi:hypothetical protein